MDIDKEIYKHIITYHTSSIPEAAIESKWIEINDPQPDSIDDQNAPPVTVIKYNKNFVIELDVNKEKAIPLDAKEWLDSKGIEYKYDLITDETTGLKTLFKGDHTFYFKNEDDAIQFKLRFGNAASN